MKIKRTMRWVAAGAMICAAVTMSGGRLEGATFLVSDIENWLGMAPGVGVSESVLVVDWGDGQQPWAWGFRWDSSLSLTGGDMLQALVLAEPRFSVSGLAGGFVSDFGWAGDLPESLDRFRGGFNPDTGEYWTYSVNNAQQAGNFNNGAAPDGAHVLPPLGNPYEDGEWVSSNTGVLGRPLVDGSWDGFFYGTFGSGGPGLPVSAPTLIPEPSTFFLAGLGILMLGLRRGR